jgi:ribosomal protein S6E (S10)
MNRVSMHRMPKGPVDSIRLVTGGQISKQNSMKAFLKNPSSPQRVAAPAYRQARSGQRERDGVRGKGVEP